MKLLMENWRGYLKEIGDASIPPFDFELDYSDETEAEYAFNSTIPADDWNAGVEGSAYSVQIKRPPAGDAWTIQFTSKSLKSDTDLTSEGQPLKIMSTVVAIIKDFINDPELNHDILKFFFEGAQKDYDSGRAGHSGTDRNQRTKLYMRYLKKLMPPGTEVREAGENVIFFEVPEGEEV